MDLYRLLELPRGSSSEAVRKQYIKLGCAWHPDQHPSAGPHFCKLCQAYQVLSNPQSRAYCEPFGLELLTSEYGICYARHLVHYLYR